MDDGWDEIYAGCNQRRRRVLHFRPQTRLQILRRIDLNEKDRPLVSPENSIRAPNGRKPRLQTSKTISIFGDAGCF